jgi:CheY-like chemotaxis protein
MSGGRPRILIVDDDVALADSLAAMLGTAGAYDIRIVHLAAEAVAVAAEHEPTIVFLDIELPDMSGYEVAKLLHQQPHLGAARLIALTDSIEHPGREDARAAGFERYLVKPVTVAELHKVLRRSASIGPGKGGNSRGEAREAIYRELP